MAERRRGWSLTCCSFAAVIATMAFVVFSGSAGTPAEGSGPVFTVYVGCGTEPSTKPSGTCRSGDRLGAFFKSEIGGIPYKVCVSFGGPRPLCTSDQVALAGVLYVDKFRSGYVGPAVATWFVQTATGPQEVGSWSFEMLPKPIVPNFGVSPLILSGTHQLFGLEIKQIGKGIRVRAWRCEGRCPLPLRLISKHGDTRRYEVVSSKGRATFPPREILLVQMETLAREDRGTEIWGRLNKGRLVPDPQGQPGDTAIRRVGPLLCVPPGADYRQAIECKHVSD